MISTRIALGTALFLLAFRPSCASDEAYAKSVVARTLLRAGKTSSGAPLDFPRDSGEVAALEVTIPAGLSTGWHTHRHSGFAYVLQGTLRVQLADSSSREYHAGEAFAEVVNTPHNGTALGSQDVKLAAFFLVDHGQPVSEKLPAK